MDLLDRANGRCFKKIQLSSAPVYRSTKNTQGIIPNASPNVNLLWPIYLNKTGNLYNIINFISLTFHYLKSKCLFIIILFKRFFVFNQKYFFQEIFLFGGGAW